MVAMLLIGKRFFSDSFARLVRTEAVSVAAELRWSPMPSTAFAGEA
ncbi:hypothetical protein ACWC5I_03270 [Kitasatospora sp. NPDC001574]